jgi:membrane protease YdiL (CAAX protease family)
MNIVFKTLIRRYPLITFFVLAFGISWLLWVPSTIFPNWPGLLTFLTGFGPAAAAILVVALVDGQKGGLQLVSSLGQWRVGVRWYLLVLLGPALMMGISISLYRVLGRESGMPETGQLFASLSSHFLALVVLFVYQMLIVWGEEIGWRGYALPKLQAKFHPLIASIILGLLWGLWHLPSFWIAGSVHQSMSVPFFVLATIGYSILYTWIYNGASGSLWIMCLLHAANNTTVSYTMLFFKPITEDPVFSLAVLALFNLLVILFAGPGLGWRQKNLETPKYQPLIS